MFWLTTITIFTNINQCNIDRNNIDNTCDFEKIRILKKDIKCTDTGQYSKYCNHYSLPNEFIVTKEIGVGNKENIIIKPQGIFRETEYSKQQIAKFTYNFICHNENGIPNLDLIISPKNDINPIWTFLFVIIIIILCIMVASICDSDNNNYRHSNNDFTWGYLLGSNNSRGTTRTYCE